jgi:DNA modification methylase
MLNKALPFQDDNDLAALPTPKMTAADRVGVHSWYKEYAAFSEKFALSALEVLSKNKKDVIFDPFLGSGTSLVAAAKFGMPFRGVELSPFSALLSRTKVSYNADQNMVFHLLEEVSDLRHIDTSTTQDAFTEEDLQFAFNVIEKIKKTTKVKGKELLNNLISNNDEKWDSFRVALLAVILSARQISTLSKGSNPVWFRKNIKISRIGAEPLSYVSNKVASLVLESLRKEASFVDSLDVEIHCGDARDIPVKSDYFDIFLTSPPYLNRLDYVVKQLPEILLLSLVEEQDLDLLKRKMIGTTKIVEKGEPCEEWGPTCLSTLEKIRNHHSVASSTYYIWNYYKYFKDIYAVLKELKRLARPNARGILVVQNSHYKEILIPVVEIFIEMGDSLGIAVKEVTNVTVKTHMGLLSPEQRGYTSKKTLKESSLYFSFNQ